MSGGNGKRSLDQEIDYVRECIERCMKMYMNKREIVNFLATQGNIQPAITRIVWGRLEKDNPEFFRAYYVRLAVQYQIVEFNRLLLAQVEELMRQRGGLLAGNPNWFDSNESHAISTPEPENTYVLNNGGPSIQACMQGTFDRYILPPNMYASQNSNVVLDQTANEQTVCGGQSDLDFSGHNNFMETNPPMADAYMSHFSNNNNMQHLDDSLLNYGLLEQHQQTSTSEYPIDSSGSSGLSLSSNAQHLYDSLFKYGFWEQFQPTYSTHEYQMDSSSSSENFELLGPGWK